MSSRSTPAYANEAASAAATVAGAVVVAAPGAGKRIRILAAWVTAADDNNLDAFVALQGTFGGNPKLIIQAAMLTFMGNMTNMGFKCDLLCDENTNIICTQGTHSVVAFGGVHYRIEDGVGTT